VLSSRVDAVPFLIENHDEACHLWRRLGVRNASLVHVDAHHDMWWLDDEGGLSIANYVCQAIKDGMVGEVIWVVPDGSWATGRLREILRLHIRRLAAAYGTPRLRIRESPRVFSARLGSTPLTICAVETIPAPAGRVLLDIDTDFLTTPAVSIGKDGASAPPWIWPDELATKLRRYDWRADIVTIAYSVTGGYTPIEWKWLGDALAMEWESPAPAAGTARAGFAALARAARTASAPPAARLRLLNEAAICLPQLGAPLFALALRHLHAGRTAQARAFFDRAAKLDPSYRGPWGSRALAYLNGGRVRDASREVRRFSTLDPRNPLV
jgi:tetratricopeptide (TPR) repeat protein